MAAVGSAEYAGHLPGLSADAVERRVLTFRGVGGAVEVAVPVLTAAQVARVAETVRAAAHGYLKTLTVAEIVTILDRAVARLLDRDDPWRQKAERLLPIVTGYDAEMVRLGLTGYLKTFRAPELRKFLAEDFASPQILDDFQPVPKGGFARAFGPDLLLHVWAGNVPALPLWSLVSGLLVKAGTVGKLPSAEPLFAGWFAQLLAEIDPRLGDCLAVVWWKGGDEAAERAWLAQADTVVAYGGNAALAAIRDRVPVTTRFLPHGHKISVALVSRAALDPRRVGEAARLAAHDIVRYDQQGCYSPQTLFVERGGRVSPRDFAGCLAHELAALARKFPRRELSMAEAGAVASWRDAQEMKGFADPGRLLLSDPAGGWCVGYTEAAEGPAPGGLNRTITVVAVDSLDEVAARLAPAKAFLQTAGIAASPEELFRLAGPLGAAGVTRICALGRMTAPEAGWHHDGRFNLLDLVTMTEIERSAEIAADGFARYAD
ncbi:acyl-CoA reductase [Azospirillum sp. TSO35-2]|uniref:acyl-CoA reductase n=1 Tax=Azospirillum sp. TSO35-2 TaxID=716796 RepID=UPI000D61BB8F|nr:acyl-CoA reductase [Azospirillum sp. TSO35-2]PWC35894.1 acyl-CoA reductase [Azospirillum sp. TSO35-2]